MLIGYYDDDDAKTISKSDIPVMLIKGDLQTKDNTNVYTVNMDDIAACERAVEYIAALGH